MSGHFLYTDCRLTKARAWVLKDSASQSTKTKTGKGSRGPDSGPICFGYCCGPNQYTVDLRGDRRN